MERYCMQLAKGTNRPAGINKKNEERRVGMTDWDSVIITEVYGLE